MKFGQSIEYDKRNIFLQKLFEKWGKKTSWTPGIFLFCKRTLYDVKVSFGRPRLKHTIKICSIMNFHKRVYD